MTLWEIICAAADAIAWALALGLVIVVESMLLLHVLQGGAQ